jgi:hypothetical protein
MSFRRAYGASPVHLLAHLVALPLAGFALLQILDQRTAARILLWLVASAVLHDLVLLPAYGLLDRLAQHAAGPAINYVRVPAALSGLLLLVFLPAIAGKGGAAFRRVSGLGQEGYLGRWLLITAALFLASGGLYLLRGRSRS